MIESLELAGFKCFGPEGIEVPLAPITLLLGPNSIGKSSILQALLALKQSWPAFPSIRNFTASGTEVDLGRFGNLLHRRGSQSVTNLKMALTCRGRPRIEFCWEDPLAGDESEGWQGLTQTERGVLEEVMVLDGELPIRFCCSYNHDRSELNLAVSADTVQRWVEAGGLDSEDLVRGTELGATVSFPVTETSTEFHPTVDWPEVEFKDTDTRTASEARAERLQILERLRARVLEPENRGTLWGQASWALGQVGALRRQARVVTHICGIRARGNRLYPVDLSNGPWQVGPTGERLVDVLLSRVRRRRRRR